MEVREIPEKCSQCHEKAISLATIPYDVQVDHDGRKYQVHVPALSAPRCAHCGKIFIDVAADRQISDAFRKQAGLMSPEQIKKQRISLGYNQEDFARVLGVAVSTVGRWENGYQIQQRFQNDVIKAFFDLPPLRKYMEDLHGLHTTGTSDNLVELAGSTGNKS